MPGDNLFHVNKWGARNQEEPVSIIITLKIALYWFEPLGNGIELCYDDEEK